MTSVLIDVTAALSAVLATNRGPGLRADDPRVPVQYGVDATLDATALAVTLTFQRHQRYCCMEWGCHLSLFTPKAWGKLREAIGEQQPPEPIQLALTVVVEEGAQFLSLSGEHRFVPSAAYRFTQNRTEVAKPIT
jgi:hypothetical protein